MAAEKIPKLTTSAMLVCSQQQRREAHVQRQKIGVSTRIEAEASTTRVP